MKTEELELLEILENVNHDLERLQADIYYEDCPELWDTLSIAQEQCAEKIRELREEGFGEDDDEDDDDEIGDEDEEG